MSRTVDIAAAVVATLNANTFSPTFTAVRAYVPVYELADLESLHVTVLPVSVEQDQVDRVAMQELHRVAIGVQQRVDPDDLPAVDALTDLTQAIADYLRDRPLTDYPAAQWESAKIDPVYAADLLETNRTYTGVVTTTYRLLHE